MTNRVTGMTNRVTGMSLLDYLWVNYGNRAVSDEIQNDSSAFIPSQKLVLDLIKQVGNSSVGSIAIKDNKLIVYSTYGLELSRIDISELSANSITVIDFGSKLVTLQDIDKGCPFDLLTKVYYITLSNGALFWAKGETFVGKDTATISTKVKDGVIESSLILDPNQGNIGLSIDKGLKASLPIKNLGEIKFEYLTLELYDKLLIKKSSTIYFIEDKPYLYLGDTKIGGYGEEGSIGEDIINRIDTIENSLTWVEHG